MKINIYETINNHPSNRIFTSVLFLIRIWPSQVFTIAICHALLDLSARSGGQISK